MVRKSLLLLVAGILGGQVALANEKISPALVSSMDQVIPGVKPDSVSHSPIDGLYELAIGPSIVYVTKDGRYLFRGDVIDLRNQTNLTDIKRKRARINTINGLDENGMIVFAPEKPKYTITVFTDITCPYCQKLHRDMDQLNSRGIKVRYLAFPRAGIPSRVYDDMVSVWCADNPQQAMTDAKATGGRQVVSKVCDNPVAAHYNMGQAIGIRGTPTIILENGDMVPGYAPPQQLVQLLEAGKAELARQ
jgi:thiol:disulfide interchange protein DsbC